MAKQILSSADCRRTIKRGVDAVADAVKLTLGPRGRNVMIGRNGQPKATRDGVTVAKEIYLADPIEDMGAAYAREVADAAVVEAGDGTTTATVLLQAIVDGGLKLVDKGAEPLLLADGIQYAFLRCSDVIRSMSREATEDLIRQVGVISTHGDIELGELIAETQSKIGKTGVIEIQESRDFATSVEVIEGFYFERGWGSNVIWLNDHAHQRSVLNNPFILISERVIAGGAPNLQIQGDHITHVLSEAIKARRPLLVIAEDLVGDALNLFATQVASGSIPGGCFVKLPGYGPTRAAAIRDLQIACGARRIHTLSSTELDDQLSSFRLTDLGECQQAIISDKRTVLAGGGGTIQQINDRVKDLIRQQQEAGNPFEREQLDHRIARLTKGVAMLKVGAYSEPAMDEKKARAEDAVFACRGALEQGVVPGGGVTLLRAAQRARAMTDSARWKEFPKDFRAGAELLYEAMEVPCQQILANAGVDERGLLDRLLIGIFDLAFPGSADSSFDIAWAAVEEIRSSRKGESFGFDAGKGTFCDLYDAGVVDPTKVVLVALEKASSIGALILTTEAAITDQAPASLVPLGPYGTGQRADFRA